jgi:hypothetical protein
MQIPYPTVSHHLEFSLLTNLIIPTDMIPIKAQILALERSRVLGCEGSLQARKSFSPLNRSMLCGLQCHPRQVFMHSVNPTKICIRDKKTSPKLSNLGQNRPMLQVELGVPSNFDSLMVWIHLHCYQIRLESLFANNYWSIIVSSRIVTFAFYPGLDYTRLLVYADADLSQFWPRLPLG